MVEIINLGVPRKTFPKLTIRNGYLISERFFELTDFTVVAIGLSLGGGIAPQFPGIWVPT
ncbi:hypothetical protein AB0M34_32635 [Nocardia sp. NPDC050193]